MLQHARVMGEVEQKYTRGLTMVELLMTIALASILSTVATIQFIDYRLEAKIAATNKTMGEIREALVGNTDIVANGTYVRPGIIVDLGEVPPSLDILVTQSTYPNFDHFEKRGWRGPYVNSNVTTWSKDAWNNNLVYSQGDRELKSMGPDGIVDTADDIVVTF